MKKLLVVLLVLGLAAPAMAAEWNWYGSARANIGWVYESDDYVGNDMQDDDERLNGIQDGNVLHQGSAGTAAIGARVKASDSISGYFEIGNTTDDDGNSEVAKFRHLVGTWNFGAGDLIVGHTNTILNSVVSTPVGTDDDPWVFHGFFYESRRDQITLQFGGLELSASQNLGFGDDEALLATGYAETAVIPKMEVAYTYKADAFSAKIGGGFQTYDIESRDGEWDDDVTSWAAMLDVRYRPGPWFVGVGGWYVVNPVSYGMNAARNVGLTGLSFGNFAINNDEIEDAEMYSAYLVGGINLNEMVALGAGVSYMSSMIDYDDVDGEDDIMSWYFQVPITLAKGVRIIPEVGGHYLSENEINGTDVDGTGGDWHYLSAKFQIDF